MRLSSLASALPLLASFGLAACSASTAPSATDFASSTATLVRAQSCADLTATLRADANAKIDAGIDRAIAAVRQYGPNAWWYGASRGDFEGGAPVAAPAAPPGANAGAAASDSSSSPKASTYTDTNTQIAGVDEADIAKTDGRLLWVLHGSELRTLKAFPTAQLADLGSAASIGIEGSPMEMFVHEGKAVVFSQVDGTTLYQGAGITSRGDYDDTQALRAPIASDGGAFYGYRPLTKVTVLTVENNAVPRVLSEQYFEGNYVSSRRVGNQVRIVLTGALHEARVLTWDPSWQTTPATVAEAIGRLEIVRARLKASVAATTHRDWLPVAFRRSAGTTAVSDAVACNEMYFPPVASTQAGLTQVHALDLGNVAAGVQSTGILGNTDVVYGNAGELVLASRAWFGGAFWGGGVTTDGPVDVAVSPPSAGESGGSGGSSSSGSAETPSSPPPAPTPTPSPSPGASFRTQDVTTPDGVRWTASTRTHLHRFTIAATGRPAYVASGSVPGYLKDQFAIDSKDGFVRVTTTEDFTLAAAPPAGVTSLTSPPRVNHLYTLATQGTSLQVRGDAGAIAPTELIYSTRFVGNYAYVVTFRQVDPLFVFDLSNPAQPVKLGELKIPGFSEYMQAIDDDHLLTIGKDANDQGRVTGLAIQLFDVTNKTLPKLQSKFVFDMSSGWATSEASNNHKAFTWSPVNKMLAIPMQRWTNGAYTASFEFFKVNVADQTGGAVDRLGFVDHAQVFGRTAANPQYCGYSVQPRRTFFYENDVVTLSTAGAVANRASDLARIASATLPVPSAASSGGSGAAPPMGRPDYCY
jgi:hypothetical protein